MKDSDHWAEIATEWIAWARKPNHDSFWAYRDALRLFIGPGTGDALDLGCGEGRIARELAEQGYRVTGVDPVPTMIAAARTMDTCAAYTVAPAAALPFRDASFDLVIAYNVLMDIEDVPAAVREMRRVVRPDARLIISIVHPFTDRGRFTGPGADAPFEIKGSYFGRDRFEDVEERGGLSMRFAGWSQPLEAYAAGFAGAGLAITRLLEPRPDLSNGRERMRRWTRVPLFLWLEVRPYGQMS